MNIRSKALAANLKSSRLLIPEWDNVEIGVREMTAAQRYEFGQEAQKSPAKATARTIIACVFDPKSGEPAFEAADQDALMQHSAKIVERIAAEILELSGLTVPAEKALEKN